MSGLLSGLRVVESSAFVAAPLGGMTLAQLGAEVIRFDPIGGGVDYRRWPVTAEGESLYWAGLNKGKRSFAVNLGDPRGRELVAALIAAPGEGGGLYLTNLPVRDGLGYDALKARRPDLIMLLIQGNPDGSTAVDYTVNAAIGFPFVTGPLDTLGPVNNVVPAWDLTCGLHAAVGLLAAERHRRLTGRGQLVRLSLFNVGAALAAALGYTGEVERNGTDRQRLGNEIYGTFGRDRRRQEGDDRRGHGAPHRRPRPRHRHARRASHARTRARARLSSRCRPLAGPRCACRVVRALVRRAQLG
jgi:2-methylfumaryl-CoA isomerase